MTLDHPWPQPPAPGTVTEVASGIFWLRMPLPFQLNHINLWLLADGEGWTVVDTGVGLDETRGLWERVFADRLGGWPVTRVLVTHFHPDHMGNAAWLTERWRTSLWCTQGEWLAAQHAWRSRTPEEMAPRLAFWRRNGAGEEALALLAKRGNHYPGLVPTVTSEFHGLREGDILTVGGRRWQVMVGYGHAPEHACLWSAEADVLISGDQVLPKITTNVSVWAEQPWENPLKLYLDSHARFRPMAAGTLVLPSHGLPFRGLHERIAMLHDHHAARLSETLDALREPRSAAEVVPVLFRRQLDTHQLGFAMGEALAHLHYLEADGRAVRVVGEDGVHRFTKA
jgi:glyoxylase-like metal-dependent hydrolase (beta-lactamase superfamily II)